MEKFYGRSTLREGLEKSRNLMTVRISQDLVSKIVNLSKSLSIHDNPTELLSFSGSAETTLLKLTSAYYPLSMEASLLNQN